MVAYILKLDYTLSVWFSKSKDKIILGTAFLFLNKIAFLWVSVFFLISSFTDLNQDIKILVGVNVLGALVIMYGLQNSIERMVSQGNFKKEYNELSKKQINQRRILALLFLVLLFAMMFIAGILSFKNYN